MLMTVTPRRYSFLGTLHNRWTLLYQRHLISMGKPVALLFFAVFCSGRVEAEEPLYVSAAQFGCVVENSVRYLAVGDFPIIIDLARCPSIPASILSLRDFSVNHGMPEVPAMTDGSIELPDTIISFMRSELECLSNSTPGEVDEEVIDLYSHECFQ